MLADGSRDISTDCVSELLLDQYLLDELDDPARARCEEHFHLCQQCRERIAEREAGFEAFAQSVDEGRRAPLRAPGTRRRTHYRFLAAAAAFAAAAILLIAFLPGILAPPPPELGRKGASVKLLYWVKRAGEVWQGAPGEVLRQGDAIRFAYSTDTDHYLALLSVDGRGTISVYHPTGPFPLRVRAGRKLLLPHSIILDDAPGRETVYAVFCTERVAVASLRAALRRSKVQPRFPGSCRVASIHFEKQDR